MGRKRKPLVEKSTALMIRIDNKMLFDLCEKYKIEIDPEAEFINDESKKQIISTLKQNFFKLLN